ncbi:FAD-dependent oxidoreductase [Thalassobacillus sp. CUG 92003]|uniref:FAD-dependent oxidoreductase n=1 Tax=Thalassobacillus sp. CUG 92003 TaxID=2736641 RepID=UPI0015E67585|nr:FAD-dependent oxidoreductase [Thalassobacillus sp. CUG 92003]
MKIAIMGAGLSGLTCALTLEKYGYQAEIYEKRGMVGDRFIVAEAMLSMFYHPYDDAVKYISEAHGIHLKPTNSVNKVFIHSEHESAHIEGQLGFINMRGKHSESFEKQLANQLKSKIHFQQNVTHEDLSKAYTHVVLATGDPMDTEQLQPYEEAFKASFKGAIVEGDFNRTDVHTFFNNKLAPKGMAYLLPHSEREASFVLVYPQYPENEGVDKEQLWNACLAEYCKRLNQDLRVRETFSIKDYRAGKTENARIGNTFFVGNCWGAISPLFGFGQFESMLTGIYAAHDIAGVGDYNELVQDLYQSYHDSLTLRRAIETLDNKQLDLLTKSVKVKWVEGLITNKHMNVLKLLSRVIHPFVRSTEK